MFYDDSFESFTVHENGEKNLDTSFSNLQYGHLVRPFSISIVAAPNGRTVIKVVEKGHDGRAALFTGATRQQAIAFAACSPHVDVGIRAVLRNLGGVRS